MFSTAVDCALSLRNETNFGKIDVAGVFILGSLSVPNFTTVNTCLETGDFSHSELNITVSPKYLSARYIFVSSTKFLPSNYNIKGLIARSPNTYEMYISGGD